MQKAVGLPKTNRYNEEEIACAPAVPRYSCRVPKGCTVDTPAHESSGQRARPLLTGEWVTLYIKIAYAGLPE